MEPSFAAGDSSCPGRAPRAAFCLVGQPRTFAHAAAHTTLAEAVQAFAADAYLFFVLTDDDAGSTKGHAAMRDNVTRTRAAIATLRPKVVQHRLEAPSEPGCAISARLRQPYFGTAQPTWRAWQLTWAKVRQCYGLVRDYEAAHGFAFDWVVRSSDSGQCSRSGPELLSER